MKSKRKSAGDETPLTDLEPSSDDFGAGSLNLASNASEEPSGEDLADKKETQDEGESPNKRDSSDNVFLRRRFIWRHVTRYGKLTFEEIEAEKKFRGVSTVAIQGDIEFWNKLGFAFTSQPTLADKRKREIVDKSSRELFSKQVRSLVRYSEKQIVGQACMGLLAGFHQWASLDNINKESPQQVESSDGIIMETPTEFDECYTVDEIRAELARKLSASSPPELQTKVRRVMERLEQFHLEHTRLVAIDAGTTCEVLASHLSRLKMPSKGTKLAHLTVCTNSRGVFQMIGIPEVDTQVIIIGGEQRDRTQAISGRLAELFLENAGILKFGISFVGATTIDLERMQCCCESQPLSRLKAQLFSKSALRVLSLDHGKLSNEPMWAAYPFVAITPEQLDLIVTNLPVIPSPDNWDNVSKMDSYRKECSDFSLAVKRIEMSGIPVFCAVPKKIVFPPNTNSEIDRIPSKDVVEATKFRPTRARDAETLIGRWQSEFVQNKRA